jgi:hypothetical protein
MALDHYLLWCFQQMFMTLNHATYQRKTYLEKNLVKVPKQQENWQKIIPKQMCTLFLVPEHHLII